MAWQTISTLRLTRTDDIFWCTCLPCHCHDVFHLVMCSEFSSLFLLAFLNIINHFFHIGYTNFQTTCRSIRLSHINGCRMTRGFWKKLHLYNFGIWKSRNKREKNTNTRQGEFSTRGRIFSHDTQNGFSLFSSF